MKVRVQSRVEGGKLVQNRKFLEDAVNQFEGQNIVVQFEKWNKKMSDKQRGYYFGVICSLIRLAIRDSWGETKTNDEVHNMLKKECNNIERINQTTGEIFKDPQSTKQHTTVEQEIYHQKCREWALEWFNIEIPLPNEQMEIDVK